MLITSYNIQINNVLISQLCQLKGHRLLFFWNKVMKVSLYKPNFFSFFNFELCIQELIQEMGGVLPPLGCPGGGSKGLQLPPIYAPENDLQSYRTLSNSILR